MARLSRVLAGTVYKRGYQMRGLGQDIIPPAGTHEPLPPPSPGANVVTGIGPIYGSVGGGGGGGGTAPSVTSAGVVSFPEGGTGATIMGVPWWVFALGIGAFLYFQSKKRKRSSS